VALIGIACSVLCDEISELAGFFDATFISAGGCYGTRMYESEKNPKTLQVVPGDHRLGDVYLKVVQKFGQVNMFTVCQLL